LNQKAVPVSLRFGLLNEGEVMSASRRLDKDGDLSAKVSVSIVHLIRQLLPRFQGTRQTMHIEAIIMNPIPSLVLVDKPDDGPPPLLDMPTYE
jgi:hypothetical protein